MSKVSPDELTKSLVNYVTSTKGIAQPVRQNMGNALKDFVNAKTAGKALLVKRKVSFSTKKRH